MPTWRYSVGRKGVSRVTVFERHDASSIFVEWWDDDGRHKQALSTVTGHPITDRELAKKAADRMSRAQERKRNQQGAELLGLPSERSLKELLDTLHRNRGDEWSESYTRDQKRYREFWLDKLGNARLMRVSAAVVERVVSQEAKKKGERGWSPRTRGAVLRYLVDAFYYAERKLKWIEPRHNLSAVSIPAAKSKSEAYTLEEARRLVLALEAVDWRAGWIAEVAFQTGRRLTAIRTLPERSAWVTLGQGYGVLHFPGETDKARNTGQAVVAGKRALRLTARAMEDWKTPSLQECQDWIEAAEKRAKIEHRSGRRWHGFKRLYATMAKGHVGREKQSGTTGQTLDRVYVQDELGPKVELAKLLAGRLAGR